MPDSVQRGGGAPRPRIDSVQPTGVTPSEEGAAPEPTAEKEAVLAEDDFGEQARLIPSAPPAHASEVQVVGGDLYAPFDRRLQNQLFVMQKAVSDHFESEPLQLRALEQFIRTNRSKINLDSLALAPDGRVAEGTFLHIHARFARAALARIFVEGGADPLTASERPGAEPWTALHQAYHEGKWYDRLAPDARGSLAREGRAIAVLYTDAAIRLHGHDTERIVAAFLPVLDTASHHSLLPVILDPSKWTANPQALARLKTAATARTLHSLDGLVEHVRTAARLSQEQCGPLEAMRDVQSRLQNRIYQSGRSEGWSVSTQGLLELLAGTLDASIQAATDAPADGSGDSQAMATGALVARFVALLDGDSLVDEVRGRLGDAAKVLREAEGARTLTQATGAATRSVEPLLRAMAAARDLISPPRAG